MKLTIAIPTYDRNDILARNLAALLPQLDGQIRLLILDNASPTPCRETLAGLLSQYPGLDVQITRNVANVGGSANVMRCFEQGKGDWLWVLGDDDRVDDAAVSTIRAAIVEYPDAAIVNFYSKSTYHPVRDRAVLTSGVEDFLTKTDAFGAILFISNSIFRRNVVLPHLKTGYNFAYSYAPHIAMLLIALGADQKAVFSDRTVISGVRDDTPREKQANGIGPILGLPTLLDLPLPEPARRQIRRLLVGAANTFLTLPGFLAHLAPLAQHDRGVFARYLFKTGAQRYFKLDRGVAIRLKLLAGTAILANTRLGFRIISGLYRKKKGVILTVPESKDFSARA